MRRVVPRCRVVLGAVTQLTQFQNCNANSHTQIATFGAHIGVTWCLVIQI